MNSFSVFHFFALKIYGVRNSTQRFSKLHVVFTLLLEIISLAYTFAHVLLQYRHTSQLSVVVQNSYFLLCFFNGLLFVCWSAVHSVEIVENSKLPHGLFMGYFAVVALAYAGVGFQYFLRKPNWFTGVRAVLELVLQVLTVNPLILYPWFLLNSSEILEQQRRNLLSTEPLDLKNYLTVLTTTTRKFSRVYSPIAVGSVTMFCWFILVDACLVLNSKAGSINYQAFLVVPFIIHSVTLICIAFACDKFILDAWNFRRNLRRALLLEVDFNHQIELRLLLQHPVVPIPSLPEGGSSKGMLRVLGSLLAYAGLVVTTPHMDTFKWLDSSS